MENLKLQNQNSCQMTSDTRQNRPSDISDFESDISHTNSKAWGHLNTN